MTDEPFVFPISSEIDLHTFAPADIPSVVEEFLRAAREKGILRVRVIHGRGRGVQRAVVQRLLAELPSVVGFSDAPEEEGGWGATLVTLSPFAVSGLTLPG